MLGHWLKEVGMEGEELGYRLAGVRSGVRTGRLDLGLGWERGQDVRD
jgi:hypothetical protein